MTEDSLYGKHGEVPVVFHGDGHFYAVHKQEDGTHVPDFGTRLVSRQKEWHHAPEDHPPHNAANPSTITNLEVE